MSEARTRIHPRVIVVIVAALYAWVLLSTFGGFGGALGSASAQYEYGRKVTICHRPPGNPENAHTITVSENAVDAHMRHGDTPGPCPN